MTDRCREEGRGSEREKERDFERKKKGGEVYEHQEQQDCFVCLCVVVWSRVMHTGVALQKKKKGKTKKEKKIHQRMTCWIFFVVLFFFAQSITSEVSTDCANSTGLQRRERNKKKKINNGRERN